MISPSDANFESFAGAGRVKPIQIGFPVELTGVWNATTGYPWKRLMLSGVAVANASPLQMTGTNAVPIDGNTALTSGTKGWLEPDPGAVGYLFITGETELTLTVEEVDGSPSYTGISTLRFDQADGFTITNPSAGVARVDFTGVTGSGTGGCVAFWDGVGAGITDLTSNTNVSVDPATGTLSAVATGGGADGIYTTRISCDSVYAEHTSGSVSAAIYTFNAGGLGDERSYLELAASPYTQVIYAGTSTTPANAVIVQTDGGTGYLRLNGTAYMHGANTGVTGTPGPGFTVSGGLVVSAGSGSFVGTASANTFTNTNSFTSPGAGDVPLTVKAAAAQTADLIQVLDSGGLTVLARVEADGEIEAASGAVRLNTVLNDGQLALYNSAGASYATLTAGASNVLTTSGGFVVTTGGLTVTAGGATITAGGLTVSAGGANITGTVTATTFSGSGASLTSLNASNVSSGTLAVDYGGTGRTSHTAYAVLCGGTTSTGAQQSVASVGTSGQVLTSNGAGALPSFQSPSTAIDITGLTAADPADGDEVPVYDVSASANRKVTVQEINALTGLAPGGRLTGSSTLPVTAADVSPSTLYYLPFVHNRVPLWDGTRWLAVTVADSGVSLVLSGLTASRVYDVFGYLSGGALTLETLIWTSSTTRATAITIQDGRYCKDGDKTRLYLGTFYANSTTTTVDSVAARWLWNAYNRRPRVMRAVKTSGNWTYATNTWRSANADSTLRCEFVLGLQEDAVVGDVAINLTGSSSAGAVGIGLDQTAGNDAQIVCEASPAGASDVQTTRARYNGTPAVGYHYLQWIEKVRAGTSTFRADLTPSVGLEVEVWA